jgi:hypothetical protein
MKHDKKAGFGHLSTGQLRARRRRLAGRGLDFTQMMAGSLVSQSRRCGKPRCGCVTGDPHGPYLYLSTATGAPSRLRYVPAALADGVKRRLSATAAVHAVLAELSAINVELLARRELD